MDILYNILIPIKKIEYIQEHFRNYFPSELENGEKYYQSKKIKFFINLLWFKSAHFLYLFIFPPKTIHEQMFHYDFANLSNLSFMNGVCIFIIFMIIYFLRLLYFSFDNTILKIVYSITILRDDSFFIEKKYGSFPILDYIRYLTLFVLNFFQVFVVAVGNLILLSDKFFIKTTIIC